MKRLLLALAFAICGLCAFPANVLTVFDGKPVTVLAPGKVASVRVLSSVASGTATLKSACEFPVVANVERYVSTTNHTYTYVYTNATETITNTVDYLPLPLGPTVTSYVTNNVITTVTNLVPTASSVVVATNSLSDAMTCTAGFATNVPTAKFVFPGDVLFFEGTAKGRVDVIIEE